MPAGPSPLDPFGRENSDRTAVKTSFVALPVSHEGRAWHTAGELRMPLGQTERPRPAVIVVHGSGGVDSRGKGYIVALNDAGFATLEIDLWAARGVYSPQERPKTVVETLPDAFAALDFLARRAGIDPARIAIMGFSWGGIVSMLSATARAPATFAHAGQRFAAHAPLYPICWAYNVLPGFEFKDLTGAPVFIQSGADDLYDDPDSCARLVASLPEKAGAHVTFETYAGATHAWDRKEPDITPNDPFAFKGKGGPVPFRYNEDVTRKSTAATVAFFSRVLRS
jgi:uncharacterized protein